MRAGPQRRQRVEHFAQGGREEMARSEREWLYQRIVEDAADAIIFADRDGVIRLWNAGAQAVFGYKPEEAVGQTLDLIVPERLRERHWEGFRRVMATGVTRYGRDQLLAVPAIGKDRERISVEFSIVMLRDAASEPLGIAAILRDVSQRWQEQQRIRKRLAELEAMSAPRPPGSA
jgi:PAS domain S-box-containing protein